MKLINATLNDKQIKSTELPEEIQNEIKALKESILKYNEAVTEYTNSGKKSKAIVTKLNAMEDNIADSEKSIVEKIKSYEKPEPVIDPTPAPQPTPDPVPTPAKEEKKQDSSFGWLVFGAVALAVTLGGVNLFKKRA